MDEIEEAAGRTANPTRYVRYHTDAEYAKEIAKASWLYKKAALAASEDQREKRRAYNREYWKTRYQTDPAFRAANNEANRACRLKRKEAAKSIDAVAGA
jgi:hypothetical protein